MSTKRLFSNGSEFYDWLDRNCFRCTKSNHPDGEAQDATCEIERAIDRNVMGIEVSAEIAARMGGVGIFGPASDCPERLLRATEAEVAEMIACEACGKALDHYVLCDLDGVQVALCGGHAGEFAAVYIYGSEAETTIDWSDVRDKALARILA